MAFLRATPRDNINTVHDEIYRQVNKCRVSDAKDSSSESIDIFNKMPRFLSRFLISVACILDRHGHLPQSLIETDPYYASAILSNLGSIKLHSGYHHLTNWGTTSLFVVIGEKKLRPFYDESGTVTMKDSVDIGLTVDERIADGYYFSGTIRMLKHLLEHPELLEDPIEKEVPNL